MVNLRFAAALLSAAFFVGCRTTRITPPVPPPLPPPTRAALPKTFGVVTNDSSGALTFSYKDLRLALDAPDSDLDFLLMSKAPKAWPTGLRKDLKIIAPAAAADAARKAGFPNAKALGTGQRLMLSKTGAFLFVSALQQRVAGTGAPVNGYLLEFDNGRNLFVAGDTTDLTPMREFVYGLRDDGKALHLAFVPAAAAGETPAAETVSLLQPEIAVFLNRGSLSEAKLNEAFTTQIFGGAWYVAAPSDTAPF